MSILRTGIFIVAAKRTPFGAFGGKLANQSCTDLAEHASRVCLAESRLPPSAIDSVIFGNVCQSSKDTAYLSRHVGLRLGLPETTSAMSVNRMCGSGLQSVASAAMEIAVGQSHAVLAGGAENMSLAPFTLHGPRYGVRRASDMLPRVVSQQIQILSSVSDGHILL
nr:unnamed protein product [Spirometra erinaceieuropaei]